MIKRIENILYVLLMLIIFVVLACITAWVVSNNGEYPSGSNTLLYLQKGQQLQQSISAGVIWPTFDATWYNGTEPLRYFSPLVFYVLAALCALGGSLQTSYLLFVGLCIILSGISWMVLGLAFKRRALGGFLGTIWFFMPANLGAFFTDGALSRALLIALLPLALGAVYAYMRSRNYKLVPLIALCAFFAVLTDAQYCPLLVFALLVFALLYSIINRTWRPQLVVVLACCCGCLLAGFWLVGSLAGTSLGASDISAYFLDPLVSLNPVARLSSTYSQLYFGLAPLLLAVFGLLCAKRNSIALALAGIALLVLTMPFASGILSVLPGSEYLMMTRIFSVAVLLILGALFFWESLRKPLTVIVCVLLVADIVPSLNLIYGSFDGRSFDERFQEMEDGWLLTQARAATEQRLLFVDEDSLESTGAYLASGFDGQTLTAFGAEYHAANTATNVTQLNRALDSGNFAYLFDRGLELGCDTVVVYSSLVDKKAYSLDDMDEAASRVGYTLLKDNGTFRAYKLDGASGTWGTVSTYEAIAIGSGSGQIALQFPAVEETTDTNLNHYTFEELSSYRMVYLNGFTYDDQTAAEDLVVRLSEAGVRVVIAADGIPEMPNSHDRVFLGVRCNDISFSHGYPVLDTIDGDLNCDLFPSETADNWQTVYLDGLDEVWGTIDEYQNDANFDFYGTVKNDNIVMVGINLTYHYALTNDPAVGELLSHAINISSTDLPEREIVPVDYEYDFTGVTVTCNADNVNTALAYKASFEGTCASTRNNLTFVNAGTTRLSCAYPLLVPGVLVSLAGLVLTVLLCLVLRRLSGKQEEPAEGEGEQQAEEQQEVGAVESETEASKES